MPRIVQLAVLALVLSGCSDEPSGPGGAPSASFTLSPAIPVVGSTFTADGSASSGSLVSWSWSFGDGASASGAVTQHVYADTGTYVITLTTEDEAGTSDSTSRTVSVAPSTSGSWRGSASTEVGTIWFSMTVTEADGAIDGSCTFEAGNEIDCQATGTHVHPDVAVVINAPGFQSADFTGTFDGPDALDGHLNASGFEYVPIRLRRQ